MLTVDVDQHFAKFTQLGGSRCDAVDESLRAAGIVDHATQQDTTLLDLKCICRQPTLGLRANCKIGRDIGTSCAFAHHAGVTAPTQGQRQGVDQDRFAGAGFPGKDSKTGRKLKVDGVDDHKIADGKRSQHAECPGYFNRPSADGYSFQCSFSRRVS